MIKHNPKVLVVATSRKTRGGITSVVKAHEQGQQWKDFHCHWVETHRDGPTWRKLAYLTKAIIDFSLRLPFYDIVHIHFSNVSSLRRKLIFAHMAKKMHKKILIHFHAFDSKTTLQGEAKSLYKELFEMANGIIVLSNWWKEEVIKAFPKTKSKIDILYNPCETVHLDNSIEKQKTILYAGTVNARKGYADLIHAFSLIAKKYPDWKLCIAGNGELEQGKRIADELGITSQVEFLGWISGTTKRETFQQASIFCLPSYAEGFPMAVLDAWAYELPVITTPVGGIPDVAKDGENMLLFNPGDIHILADSLNRLISNDSLRLKLSAASRSLARNQFNRETINQALETIYNKL